MGDVGVRDEMRFAMSALVKAVGSSGFEGEVPATVAMRRPEARVRRPALAARARQTVSGWLGVRGRGKGGRTQDAEVGGELLAAVDAVLDALRELALALGGVDLDGDLEGAVEEAVEVGLVVAVAREEVEGEDEVERVLGLEGGELEDVGREGRGGAGDEDLECAHGASGCPGDEDEREGERASGGDRRR